MPKYVKHDFEVYLRLRILWLYSEHSTISLVPLQEGRRYTCELGWLFLYIESSLKYIVHTNKRTHDVDIDMDRYSFVAVSVNWGSFLWVSS